MFQVPQRLAVVVVLHGFVTCNPSSEDHEEPEQQGPWIGVEFLNGESPMVMFNGRHKKGEYLLVNVYITMDNHHFYWENSLEMAIFNSKLLVITRGSPS